MASEQYSEHNSTEGQIIGLSPRTETFELLDWYDYNEKLGLYSSLISQIKDIPGYVERFEKPPTPPPTTAQKLTNLVLEVLLPSRSQPKPTSTTAEERAFSHLMRVRKQIHNRLSSVIRRKIIKHANEGTTQHQLRIDDEINTAYSLQINIILGTNDDYGLPHIGWLGDHEEYFLVGDLADYFNLARRALEVIRQEACTHNPQDFTVGILRSALTDRVCPDRSYIGGLDHSGVIVDQLRKANILNFEGDILQYQTANSLVVLR